MKALSKDSTPTKTLDLGHIDSSAAIKTQARVELENLKGKKGEEKKGKERSEEEVRASKVSDAQIKRYWKEKEGERIARRVHQEELSIEEKVLRLFDMSSQFGVSLSSSHSFSLYPHVHRFNSFLMSPS